MLKYKVVFAVDYVVEASNEEEAIAKAEEMFTKDMDRLPMGLMFGANAIEL